MDENSDKSGFFSRIRDGFRDGIRPGFLGGAGGGEVPSGSRADKKAKERAATNGAAAGDLKDAEGAASGGLYHGGDGLDDARTNEQTGGGGLYSGGVDSAASNKKKGESKGMLKKGGPIFAVLLTIVVVGAIMGLSQGSQLFSLVANLQESHNSMHISAYKRSADIIRRQLSGDTKTFAMSEKQIAEYEKHGIKYNEAYETPDGRTIRVLEYDTDSGQHKIVTADNDMATYLRNNGVAALSIDAAESDTSFHQKFTAASQIWRGQFANWYGWLTNNWYKKNNLTRNMTKNYKQKVAEANGDGGKVMRDMLKERTNTVDFGAEGKAKRDSLNQNEIRNKLSRIAGKFDWSNPLDVVTNSSCAFVDIMGAFSGLVYAAQALQIMNIATLTFETVDKTKAGYGDEAPFNELASMFNEKTSNTNAILSAEDGGSVENVKLKTDYVTTTKSAMESEGIASLYSGKRANPNDPSLKSFNLTGSIKSVMGGIGGNMSVFEGCSFAKVGTAIVSGIGEGIGIAACIAGILAGGIPGVLSCAPLVAGTLIGMLEGALIAGGIEILITSLAPMVTSMLVRDVTGVGGEDFGNANTLSSNLLNGSVGRTNGLAYASINSYKSFAIAKQQVAAEDARYERETLSPFDITSKNTFMGAIMNRMAGFVTTSSLMNNIVVSNSIISSSLMKLMPSVSATASQIAEDLPTNEEYAEYCPFLASVGGIGDSGCIPYSDSDFSTINDAPGEVVDVLDGLGAFSGETSDGNKKIDEDSDFAKYIRYCDGRSSMPGTPDLNIKNEVTSKTSTGNTVLDGAIGSAPAFGEGLTILEETEVQRNFGYIGGGSCVDQGGDLMAIAYNGESEVRLTAGTVSGTVANPNWNVAKYYQRFIEDQSLMESMGVIEKSAVATYLEEYYEKNPLDNSYEGMLARYSGLDKETVSDALDVIAYYNYIDNYDASERYAFGAPVVDEDEKVLDLDNEYVMDGMMVALKGVVYADVRNRTFVV